MLGIADLLTVCVLEEAFEFLAKNPHHLEFILCSFVQNERLSKKVGAEHIKHAVEFITQNKISIATFYEADMAKIPSIAIVSSGVESDRFIGDSAVYTTPRASFNDPGVFGKWSALSISGDEMTVPNSLGLENKLWPGLIVENELDGLPTAKIEGILVRDGVTKLFLSNKLPDGISLTNWFARSSGSNKKYKLAASIDDVTIQCKLTTSGDYSVHRLLAIATRWAIKKYRLRFDDYGIQNVTFSYTPPMMTDEAQSIFETAFTISAKATDHWIDYEFLTIDASTDIKLTTIAHSDDFSNEDVEFE